eukprot:c23006_g1_i2 orf=95-274(+)
MFREYLDLKYIGVLGSPGGGWSALAVAFIPRLVAAGKCMVSFISLSLFDQVSNVWLVAS